MYQQVVKNQDGEPLYVEEVRSPYEEEIAYCEEMDERAHDPLYAASIEDEKWYNLACSIFEERGIQVPESVIQALKRELRKKKEDREMKAAMAKAQPAVDFLNKYFPGVFETRYSPPDPDEIGYAYISYTDWSKRPFRDEVRPIIDLALQQDIFIEDYLDIRELKRRIPENTEKQ